LNSKDVANACVQHYNSIETSFDNFDIIGR